MRQRKWHDCSAMISRGRPRYRDRAAKLLCEYQETTLTALRVCLYHMQSSVKPVRQILLIVKRPTKSRGEAPSIDTHMVAGTSPQHKQYSAYIHLNRLLYSQFLCKTPDVPHIVHQSDLYTKPPSRSDEFATYLSSLDPAYIHTVLDRSYEFATYRRNTARKRPTSLLLHHLDPKGKRT